MECPKCKSIIDDNAKVCPHCHKVLLIECPNCHNLSESAVCDKCGYTILTKCSKCSKMNLTENEYCQKCGFPVNTSLANQECECDELTSVRIKIESLHKIRLLLKSNKLYSKFYKKVQQQLDEIINKTECKCIKYEDMYVVNFNKEISFATSANKATRFALKIANLLSELNLKVNNQFGFPLNLSIVLTKKKAENLQKAITYKNNIKLLDTKPDLPVYLKGMQILIDQYVFDAVNKEYKADSLFSVEDEGKQLMLYEILIQHYVLPPVEKKEKPKPPKAEVVTKKIPEKKNAEVEVFNIFDINAKCNFEKIPQVELLERFAKFDFEKDKVISFASSLDDKVYIPDIIDFFEKKDKRVIPVSCTRKISYRPWGIFLDIFKTVNNISLMKSGLDLSKFDEAYLNRFKLLFDLLREIPCKSSASEDARYAYMECIEDFLGTLKDIVIIIDGFSDVDDTTLQTLEIYFERYQKIKPVFIFINDIRQPVHSKLKGLLRVPCYTELTLIKSDTDKMFNSLEGDCEDVIQSYYYQKIKDCADGSYFYFKNIIDYLKELGIILTFEGKTIVRENNIVVLPNNVENIYRTRIKNLGKTASAAYILAYSYFLGERIDIKTLRKLSISNFEQGLQILKEAGLIYTKNKVMYVNNYHFLRSVLGVSMKKNVQLSIAKNIIAQLGKDLDITNMAYLFSIPDAYKEEYLLLWKNADFAIKTGDYDAYLENCLQFLSLVEKIDIDVPKEVIENNKKEVYNQILLCLYSYSPTKIYFIENLLLSDAISENDGDKIVKLSNLMLQGALISSNYTDALGLLHNILSRVPTTSLVVDGEINKKMVLLSLVEVEILYNTGKYVECINVANKILSILDKENILAIKPVNFSINLFTEHIIESMRLAILSKLYILDDDVENFIELLEDKLQIEFKDKQCILDIKSALANQNTITDSGDDKYSSGYSKLILSIIKNLINMKDDYRSFAQNIYQLKLQALNLHQKEIELFCDLLIGFAYYKVNMYKKSDLIYNDILNFAEQNALYNIVCITRYLIAHLRFAQGQTETALRIINDVLSLIRKNDNQCKLFYVIFEKLYIQIIKSQNLSTLNIDMEELKIAPYKDVLARFYD